MLNAKAVIFSLAMMAQISCAEEPTGNLNCELDNPALQAMPPGEVTFIKANGERLDIDVKLADQTNTRAAGFQKVCASTVVKTPILFIFEAEVTPAFHMRNVVTPLDIAFVTRRGTIDSIYTMKTYVLGSNQRPLYRSKGPVVAALEVAPGFYAQHGIDNAAQMEWRRVTD